MASISEKEIFGDWQRDLPPPPLFDIFLQIWDDELGTETDDDINYEEYAFLLEDTLTVYACKNARKCMKTHCVSL